MHNSGQFHSGAPKLKTKLWWQRTRLWVILIIIIIVVILAGVCGLVVWVAVTFKEGVDVANCGISPISISHWVISASDVMILCQMSLDGHLKRRTFLQNGITPSVLCAWLNLMGTFFFLLLEMGE